MNPQRMEPIRRRTPQERDAYLQGFRAGAETALEYLKDPSITVTGMGHIDRLITLIRRSEEDLR